MVAKKKTKKKELKIPFKSYSHNNVSMDFTFDYIPEKNMPFVVILKQRNK